MLQDIFPRQKLQHLDQVFNGKEIHITTPFNEHSLEIPTINDDQYRLAPCSTSSYENSAYYGPQESSYGFSTRFKVDQTP